MIKTIFNKVLMLLYFVVGALVLELVTFHILGLNGLPKYFWYNFAVIFFISIVVYAIPNYTAQYVVYSIILLIQGVFAYLNYSLHVVYHDLFTMEMLNLTGELGTAMNSSFVYLTVILQLAGVLLSIIVLGAILLKYCRKQKINVKEHFSVFNVITLVSCSCFSISYYVHKRNTINEFAMESTESYVESDAFLLNSNFMKTASYSKFGTYGYFTNLIFNKFGNYNKIYINSALKYFKSGNIYDGKYSAYNSATGEYEQVENKMYGKANSDYDPNDSTTSKENVIVIMMESLEWFGFGDGNYDREFNNLSDELTPNIYGLINQDRSMIAKNFFAKSKTNYSEAIGLIGHYPKGWSLSDIAGKNFNSELNTLGYSLPNTLRNNGYTTSYIHSNVLSFYHRGDTHYNLGFDNVYGKDSIVKNKETGEKYAGEDLKWENWEAEGDFARNAIDYIIPYDPERSDNKPFFSFYLTVSTHGGYDYNEKEVDCVRFRDVVMYGKENCQEQIEEHAGKNIKVWRLKPEFYSMVRYDETNHIYVKIDENDTRLNYTEWYDNMRSNYSGDSELVSDLFNYQCAVCGLDEAIGVIVDKLNEYNIMDNTTLLLYSDHYAYYKFMSNRIKHKDLSDVSDIELNTIPMILSSNCLKDYHKTDREKTYLEYDRFCSAYDIIPTVLDMLGIEYNQNMYVGESLFMPSDYIYQIDGKTRDMLVYCSITDGLFSRDVYTYDMTNFKKQNYNADDKVIEVFKSKAYQVLAKLNYLQILDVYDLYNQIYSE